MAGTPPFWSRCELFSFAFFSLLLDDITGVSNESGLMYGSIPTTPQTVFTTVKFFDVMCNYMYILYFNIE